MTIKTGDEIPELVKHPTTQQLVQYAGAQGDFYQIHYDQDFARGVLHELARGRVLDQLRDFISDLDGHRRIAVPRSLATGRPCWLTYSVSKMMNRSEPLDPVFS